MGAGTPADIILKLRAAVAGASCAPAMVQTINRAGSQLDDPDAPDVQACWDADAMLRMHAVRKKGNVQ